MFTVTGRPLEIVKLKKTGVLDNSKECCYDYRFFSLGSAKAASTEAAAWRSKESQLRASAKYLRNEIDDLKQKISDAEYNANRCRRKALMSEYKSGTETIKEVDSHKPPCQECGATPCDCLPF